MQHFYRLKAHELAVEANKSYTKGCEYQKERRVYQEKRKIIEKFFTLINAFLYTLLYFFLAIVDGIIMSPIIRVLVTDTLQFNEKWFAPFMFVYYVIIVTLTVKMGEGLSKKWGKNMKLMEIELLSTVIPGTPRSSMEKLINIQTEKDFRKGIGYLAALVVFLLMLSLIRNSYLHQNENFKIILRSPSDWVNTIIWPVGLAVLMGLIGIYKNAVIKLLAFRRKVERLEDTSQSFFEETSELDRQALEHDLEATKLNETIPTSKDLSAVWARFRHSSELDGKYQALRLKILKQGAPVANIQIMGLDQNDKDVYALTDIDGWAILKWKTVGHLKLVYIENIPLKGHLFDDGEEIPVEVESVVSSFLTENPNHKIRSRLLQTNY
jgi:hypothetical protein